MESSSILNKILLAPSMKLIEVLDENEQYSMISFLGEVTFETNEKFIIKLKKKPFVADDLSTVIESLKESIIEQYLRNDIYSKHLVQNFATSNAVDLELVYPATDDAIAKNRKPSFEIISETKEIYLQRTLPFINSLNPNHIKWIDNVLYNNTEVPQCKNELFIILKNYTTANDKSVLDCIGIPYTKENDKPIRSLRDLTDKNLPLLEAFYSEGKKKLAEVFNVKPNEIRAFVHYPPSFYYFHIHFLHISIENFTACVNRGIDLREIIENIKIKGDYYQNITIDHTVKKGTKLFEYLTK